jgi:stage III sporulation protein SpoIIIAA
VRAQLEGHPELGSLLEVVMDLGRPPLARFPGGDARLGEGVITGADLEYAVAQVRPGTHSWRGGGGVLL